eukprot:Hpha_TRINITY_DN4282_c0_g1::TRINITY_DN4282_c0_g1_i2::g.186593::m.186593/K05941/E2.3.2.15; glutathione gamma-glutamylcysteinyltransferase
MVRNALKHADPRTVEPPPVTEEQLNCPVPFEEVRARGLTFDQLADVAALNGLKVDARRASPEDPGLVDVLRSDVINACVAESLEPVAPRPMVILSWKRAALEQTGEGHFSPLAGYHAGRDLVLVMDTARFKYAPYWVSVGRLYDAMCPSDPDTGQPRGWMK